jgi:hypothetical protein
VRRAVEGCRELGPPVDDDRVTAIVVDVTAADIPALGAVFGVVEVEATEEERGGRVVGERLDPSMQGDGEEFRGDLVAADRVVPQRFSLGTHPRQLGPCVVEIALFLAQVIAAAGGVDGCGASGGGGIGRVVGRHGRTPPVRKGEELSYRRQVLPSNGFRQAWCG